MGVCFERIGIRPPGGLGDHFLWGFLLLQLLGAVGLLAGAKAILEPASDLGFLLLIIGLVRWWRSRMKMWPHGPGAP